MNAPRLAGRLGLGVCLLAGLCLLPAFVRANPEDPFDPANKAPVLSTKTRKLMELIRFKVKASPLKVKPGEFVRIAIEGAPIEGFHAYPITIRTEHNLPSHPQIEYSGIDGLRPLWPIEESRPELALDLNKKPVFEHDKPFTWTQDLLTDAKTKPGVYELKITIKNLQICDKSNCFGPDVFKPFYVDIEVLAGDAVTPGKDVTDRLQGPPAVKTVTPTAEELAKLNQDGNKPGLPGKREVDATNLLSFLGAASLGAFLMLLTPCVFPMIPITVNFFLKQSEKEHHNPLAMASVYSGTIIVLLTSIMLAFGSWIIDIANNEWFNLALGVVLIGFALSLFGMYEIELPHFLSRYTSAHEGRGGLIGTVFMAMTFTITSFTCTGPFLGLMLGLVAGVKPPWFNLFLAAVVYSMTFAAPFFVLALFPSLLKKLPKSGSWLNSVKVTMGFLELGAALKFLSNADFVFFPGNPQLFNYDTVLAAWIALSISCSAYLLGLFRLPHDDKLESIGVIRMLIAVGFLSLSVYLAPAMFGLHPAGVIGDNAIAFLPKRTGHDNDAFGGGGAAGAEKKWHLDYDDAYKEAIDSDKLIFIDFTATQCTNCRYNEESVFPLPPVKEQLSKFVKVSLYTDTVPNPKLSSAEAKQQGARNAAWQAALTKKDRGADNVALPTYIIIKPARDKAVEEDGSPKGTILGNTNGAIFDVPGFVRILEGAQATKIAQAKQALHWHRDYKAAWKEAATTDKLIFINFTAAYSTNGRYNEEVILTSAQVDNELRQFVRLELYVDIVPDSSLTKAESKDQAKRNHEWQSALAKSNAVPMYLVFRPDRNDAAVDAVPKGTVVTIHSGLIDDVPEFVSILSKARAAGA